MACISFTNNLDYHFTADLIYKTRDLNKLLTLELELSRYCNYQCGYCYSSAGKALNSELSIDEIYNVIEQGKDMGVRTIIIIGGGEPLLYKNIKQVIEHIFINRMNIILFTNGSLLDIEMAKFLFKYNVFPFIKVNGLRPKTINWLCGNRHAYNYYLNALSCLQKAGYYDKSQNVGISTIICKQNYDQIPLLWEWCRNNNFIPYFERLSSQGRAIKNNLDISIEQLKGLFEKLALIDKQKYNIQWDSIQPPIANTVCTRHYYSIYIRSDGRVLPCSGIDIEVGNIRKATLAEIIMNSKVLQDLRHIDKKVKGKCRSCQQANLCYGCRGNAYQITQDYLAADPMCWRHSV